MYSPYFVGDYEGLELERKSDLLHAVYSTPVDVELAAEAKFEGAEQAGTFEGLAASDDAFEGFVWAKTEGVLAKNRALIEIRCDEVGGDSDNFHAFVVCLAVGGSSWEGRKQGWVDIEDPIFPVPDEVGGKDFHEASQYHEVDLGFFQMGLQSGLRLGPIPVVEGSEREAVGSGDFAEMGMVADHEDDVGVQAAGIPDAEDGFGRMSFLGNEKGDSAPALAAFREAESQLHPQMSGDSFQLGAHMFFVDGGGGPGGEEAHTELATGDLFFEGFDVCAQAKKLLSDGGDGSCAIWADEGDGEKRAIRHGQSHWWVQESIVLLRVICIKNHS